MRNKYPCYNVDTKRFCEIALLIASGIFPTRKVHRPVDVEPSSGQKKSNVPYREIDSFIRLIAEVKGDFPIMNSTDSFLQFYGVGNQFAAEMRVNLPDDDYHTYSFVDPEKMQQTEETKKLNANLFQSLRTI